MQKMQDFNPLSLRTAFLLNEISFFFCDLNCIKGHSQFLKRNKIQLYCLLHKEKFSHTTVNFKKNSVNRMLSAVLQCSCIIIIRSIFLTAIFLVLYKYVNLSTIFIWIYILYQHQIDYYISHNIYLTC